MARKAKPKPKQPAMLKPKGKRPKKPKGGSVGFGGTLSGHKTPFGMMGD